MKNKTLSLKLVAAIVSMAVPGSAGVLTFGSLSSWQSAGTTTTTTTFDGVNIVANTTTSYTVAPVTFVAATGYYLTVANTIYGPGSGNFLSSPSPLLLNPNSSVYGLAFDFNCYGCNGANGTVTVTDSGGTTFSPVTFSATGHTTFFGVRSDLSIQSVRISFDSSNGAPTVAVDNVASDTTAPVPEPTTVLMIGGGLALMARLSKSIAFSRFA